MLESAILERLLIFELNSQTNTPVCCLFVSNLQSQGSVRTLDLFSAHTQNGQLVDHEEMFAEFDKKCIGLELLTAPLRYIQFSLI